MENSFQTSFIPKKPIIANGAGSGTKSATSLSIVVSVFILVVVILAAVGLYFYKDYLLKNKEVLHTNLLQVQNKFDKNTIVELELYDKRTAVAKEVLGGHIVLSPIFEAINGITLSSIQFTSFSHNNKDNIFSVQMSGIARDYKSIALQADVFNTDKGKNFKDVIFSNITKDKNNYVNFNIEFDVDPSLLSYSNNISNSESGQSENTNTPDLNTTTADTTLPTTSNTQ